MVIVLFIAIFASVLYRVIARPGGNRTGVRADNLYRDQLRKPSPLYWDSELEAFLIIAQQDINSADDDSAQGKDYADSGVFFEADVKAVAVCDAHGYDIGACSDQGAVPSETGAQRQ